MLKFRSIIGLTLIIAASVALVIACSTDENDPTCGVSTTATGDIITGLQATGTGGGAPFDGTVNTLSDLNDLAETAWGDGNLDLHRGHAPIENVLQTFLGISHTKMHTMMEDCNMNLADVCTAFGFDPENLVETLTQSFVPFIEQGVANGVISSSEAATWTETIRTQFRNRVNWAG